MFRAKEHEDNTAERDTHSQAGLIKFKPFDRRKLGRKAPVRHPWRQYKAAQCKAES